THGPHRAVHSFPTRRSSDLTSPRVAPGLLSWPAWEALRSAADVQVPVGHPLLPALDEAGIGYRVAEGIPEVESLAAGGTVVWLRSEEHTSELQSRSDLVCRL